MATITSLGGGSSGGGGNARPSSYVNQAIGPNGMPLLGSSTPDNSLNEQAREFDVTSGDKEQILALLQAAVKQASGTNLGGVTAPQINVAPGSANVSPYAPSPYDASADTAAFTAAKQKTGQELQGALSGLRNAMQARGITGSGIEGQGAESLYASGLSDLSNVNAAQAEGTAGRAFTANQAALSRGEQAREYDTGQQTDVAKFNASNALNASQFNVTTAANKLATLVGAYKGLY
jgi:hypothetical protein